MRQVVLLTDAFTLASVLIGVESIITAKEVIRDHSDGSKILCTKIESRGAMVSTNWVTESPVEIYDKINQHGKI